GRLVISSTDVDGVPRLDILALDKGPGMEDPIECLRDGFSTAGTAGQGLGAVLRMSDIFDLYTQTDRGTAVLSTLYQSRPPQPPTADIGGVCVPLEGEIRCGDCWALFGIGDRLVLMVFDGLGHGMIAAEAAEAACRSAASVASESPKIILETVHKALYHTRGGAALIVEADWRRGILRQAGIGNVAGRMLRGQLYRSFLSMEGILGEQVRRLEEISLPLESYPLLVVHTDGLSTRWDLKDYPGLANHRAALIAGVLFRDFYRQRDDGTVVVIKRGPNHDRYSQSDGHFD
ncbi:MAG: SpoIIE family protein phosphatase, partial [candidate division KSB1 bacterium]|nr:SpoIIE family protein phosphatase [candidate division KSB1 bacterium]